MNNERDASNERSEVPKPSADRPVPGLRPRGAPRPSGVFDPGLQHERTSLAWERTAVSTIVAGVLLARFSAQSGHFLIGIFSLVVVVYGSFVLLWAALHYEELHTTLRAGHTPAHPQMSRFVGIATVSMTAIAIVIVLLVVWEG